MSINSERTSFPHCPVVVFLEEYQIGVKESYVQLLTYGILNLFWDHMYHA